MSSIDLSRFNFSGGENAAPIEDLTRLPREDQQRLVLAGIDVHDDKVSGAFMQLNHADVHCTTRQEGLELMDIRAAPRNSTACRSITGNCSIPTRTRSPAWPANTSTAATSCAPARA